MDSALLLLLYEPVFTTFYYGKGVFLVEKKLPKIEIIEKYCKGCHICVEFCPKDVLEMKGFYASVKNLEACISCMQCELRCPDFAIKVITE